MNLIKKNIISRYQGTRINMNQLKKCKINKENDFNDWKFNCRINEIYFKCNTN